MTSLEKSKYLYAGIVLLLTVGILYILIFKEVPSESKDVLNVGLGVMLAAVKSTIDYLFGSSEGSTTKTAILEGRKENENEIPIDLLTRP